MLEVHSGPVQGGVAENGQVLLADDALAEVAGVVAVGVGEVQGRVVDTLNPVTPVTGRSPETRKVSCAVMEPGSIAVSEVAWNSR